MNDMMNHQEIECLDPVNFEFYTPEEGSSVKIGPQQREIPLPRIPMPVGRDEEREAPPTEDMLGQGIYDYLRQFPDCALNEQYAVILRDAFPHYLSDLASQIVMLDYKEVDAPYIRRQISYMKILLLLDPDNAGLLHQLGTACMEVGLSFSQLNNVRNDFLKALGYFQRAVRVAVPDAATLNCLAQINYWLGDYPASSRLWQQVHDNLDEGHVKDIIREKIDRIEAGSVPAYPLVDDLEAVGQALVLCGGKDYPQALQILETLEEQGHLLEEFPMPEFHYLLGLCREKVGDIGGAFAAYDRALEMNPHYEDALQGKDRILETGGG